MNLEAAAFSDAGKVRATNEDAFGHCVDAGVFAVCDGMGGAAAGEVASRLAVDALIERLCAVKSEEDRRRAMTEAVTAANRLIYAQAAQDPTLQGMGTTLVAAAIQDHHALICHVGDSRCYLFRAGKLTRQTNDHSLVEEQVRLGHMTRQDAKHSPLKNVITRAIGTQKSVEPEIKELPLEPGDILLLCSDGLTGEVSEDRMAAMLEAPGTIDQRCRRLIDAANEAGSHDNVTALLIRAE
jgi:protein phosphatase